MFDRIQNIGSVTGSNNLFINGNVVVNDEILPTIAAHLLRPEFEMLSLEARKRDQGTVLILCKKPPTCSHQAEGLVRVPLLRVRVIN